jgi:hypothetical protein
LVFQSIDRKLIDRHVAKILLELWMGHQGIVDLCRRVAPLDATIKSFGILTEDHDVDHRFIHGIVGGTPHEIQWISLV